MLDLDKLFHPRTIALIGVSDAPIKGASAFLFALRSVNFPNPVYNVNKSRDRVLFDEIAYPSILDIPDDIDYAIIGVPAREVPQIIKECSEKGVKFATIFTSGFSELGTSEGIGLEEAFLRNAKGMRIVGPNCLGVYCQESKVTITEVLEILEKPGEIAFISQSGGHTGSFYSIGKGLGFTFNKLVSIGNQCDLTVQDFIEYFGDDEPIKVVAAYIERVKTPKNFLNILANVSHKKPVILWKGGSTKEGTLAAASHTGSISSSYAVFKAAIAQHGGILTESIDELADLTLGALFLSQNHLGKRIGIVVPGGGSCVEMSDEAARNGLQIPELAAKSQEKLQAIIQEINTSTRNPVDLGVLGWIPNVYYKSLSYIAEDPNVDIVIFYFMLERLPAMARRIHDPALGRAFLKNIGRAKRKSKKSFIAIVPNFILTDPDLTQLRKEFIGGLISLGIPYFSSMNRAANVVSKLIQYQMTKRNRSK